MLSVGEVMSIGRSFEEVIQKACRMVNPALDGLEGIDSNLTDDEIPLEEQISVPTDTRLFAVQRALEEGWGVDKVFEHTKIDKWFLSKLENIAKMRKACKDCGDVRKLFAENGTDRMRSLKIAGFSDQQVSGIKQRNDLSFLGYHLLTLPLISFVGDCSLHQPLRTRRNNESEVYQEVIGSKALRKAD